MYTNSIPHGLTNLWVTDKTVDLTNRIKVRDVVNHFLNVVWYNIETD